jgi:tetratricopeptide (TPR) repeat protein
LEISERLAKSNPHSEQLQRDYAVAAYKYAQILSHFGDKEKAKKYYDIDFQLSLKICTLNANNWSLWEDLAISAENMAAILLKNKEKHSNIVPYAQKAAEAYQKAFDLTKIERFKTKVQDILDTYRQ